ncbi:replication factor-A protein 1, partial [Baffinella frigidus]
MAHQALTVGAIEGIYNNVGIPTPETPDTPTIIRVVQVVEVKRIAQNPNRPQEANARFIVVISDGVQSCQAMLATQQNHLVLENQLRKHSIIRVSECFCNQIQHHKIVILLNVAVLEPWQSGLIGNPQPVDPAEKLRADALALAAVFSVVIAEHNARSGLSDGLPGFRQDFRIEVPFYIEDVAGVVGGQFEGVMPDPNTVAFPYPLMRCIPSGRGPEGIPG